ncbi:MAG: ADP-ribosylglycohydrolase family protein [Dehalococcoidia bacterium]
MIDNTGLLHDLIANRTIRLNNGAFLNNIPNNLSEYFTFDKVEGMLLGAAIGDSLGATSEGLTGRKRLSKYGEIRDYLPGHRSNNRSIGVPTDDTQLTFWTLKQLIEDHGLVPDNLAKRFCEHHITGIGSTVRAFIGNYKDYHKPWYLSGEDSLGNGALMRISPVLIPYLRSPHRSMYADAAISAMITHNSYANNATCVAFINILWQLLSMNEAPIPSWWSETFSSATKDLEGDTKYSTSKNSHCTYSGPLWQYTETVINDALQNDYSVLEACEKWGSGASLMETIPSVLYILAKHAHDPQEAIIRAVNDTKDSDTIGSIVGAAVGALHGIGNIPDRWIHGLTGRTRTGSDDTGEVFKLILSAKKTFWS